MTDDRIAALERRVRALDDQLAIGQLIATYGPAVDSESAEAVGELWSADGVYDPGGVTPYTGRAAVAGLVYGERHQGYLEAGCAHVLSAPRVSVEGDVAVAVNHSRVYLKDGPHWRLERVSANRWELERIDGTWQVIRRTNRLLDGTPEARRLLTPPGRLPRGPAQDPAPLPRLARRAARSASNLAGASAYSTVSLDWLSAASPNGSTDAARSRSA